MKKRYVKYHIFFTLTLMLVSVQSFAQLLDRELSINMVQAPFGDVLKHIESRAGIRFAYSTDQLNLKEPVTLQVDNRPLREILSELFIPRGIEFRLHEQEGTITLRRKPEESQQQQRREARHPMTLSGVVSDMKGQPLAGVNVLEKGTTNGTVTDALGSYSLQVESGVTVVFSFIGYRSVEQAVRTETTLTITLEEDTQSLEEVTINAGYYEVTQREQTGNIARITSKEIEQQPVTNALAALIGRTPGVMITQGSGLPGGNFSLEIRGRNSFRLDGNDPLYLVDGVPFPSSSMSQLGGSVVPGANPLNTLSPQDIESIDILKDADATAIYGSRGANGVVLITTKRGKAGKTRLDMNISSSMSSVNTNRMPLLSLDPYLEMRKEAIVNDGRWNQVGNPVFSNNWPDLVVWDTTRSTNWRKELLGGTAATQNAQASLSGGNANTQFLLSGNFSRESTVFPGDFSFLRGSGHMHINHVYNRFSISASSTFSKTLGDLPATDFAVYAMTLAPNAPPGFTEDGSLNWAINNGTATWDNPYSVLHKPYTTGSTNLNTNATMSFEVFTGLKLKATGGYNLTLQDETQLIYRKSLSPTNASAQASNAQADNRITTWIAEPVIEYTKPIAQGKLTSMVGMTFNSIMQEGHRLLGTGFASDALVPNIDAATIIDMQRLISEEYKYAALFARVHYNWNEKYLINLTGRRDGSSRFGEDNRMANFGAVGAAWVISNESFLKDNSILSFAKLRSSYGVTGSDQIGNYRYLDSYQPSTFPYVTTGLEPVRLANPDYGWESNTKFELGLETGWLDDRIQFMASYYHNLSSNQLIGLPLPAMTGFTSIQSNLPASIQNTGLELVAQTINIKSKKFTWSTSINFTLPDSKVVSFPNLEDLADYSSRFVVGQPTTISLRYHYLGLDTQTGNYQFLDVNGDGSIQRLTDAKQQIDLGPKYFGGLNNSLRYGPLQLDLMLQFVKQSGIDAVAYFPMPGTLNNQPTPVMNRWQQPGDDHQYRRFAATSTQSNYSLWQGSDAVIADISFIRVKNISLSWQLPLRSNPVVSQGRLFIHGQNLFTFSPYQGVDPEVRGITSLPPLRTINMGINLTF